MTPFIDHDRRIKELDRRAERYRREKGRRKADLLQSRKQLEWCFIGTLISITALVMTLLTR